MLYEKYWEKNQISRKKFEKTCIEKDGNELQSGVIKNDYTPGIKEGRDREKGLFLFFILKNNIDCQYLKATSFPSKVFGEKWGGKERKKFSKGPASMTGQATFIYVFTFGTRTFP